jgi:hypothetical protein
MDVEVLLQNPDVAEAHNGSLGTYIAAFGPPKAWGTGFPSDLAAHRTSDSALAATYFKEGASGDYTQADIFSHILNDAHNQWPLQAFPLRQTNKLVEEYATYDTHSTPLDAQPEGSAPRLVTHSGEKGHTVMARYGKAIQMLADAMRTPEGQFLFQLGKRQLQFGTRMTFKMTAQDALAHEDVELQYRFGSDVRGTPTLNQRWQENTSCFGIVDKRSDALFLLINKGKEIMGRYPTGGVPNLVVVPQGLLTKTALTNALDPEKQMTEASTNTALATPQKYTSVTVQKAGVTLKEDYPVPVGGDFGVTEEFLNRQRGIGLFTNVSWRDCTDPAADSNEVMSIMYFNAPLGEFALMRPSEMLDMDTRWTNQGNLSPDLYALCNEANSKKRGPNDKGRDGNATCDPYIWVDERGHHGVAESYGQMMPSTLEDECVRTHAKSAAYRLRKTCGDRNLNLVSDTIELSKSLWKCDGLAQNVRDLFAAISLMDGNYGTNSIQNLTIAGVEGAPILPYRNSDGYLYADDPFSPEGADARGIFGVYPIDRNVDGELEERKLTRHFLLQTAHAIWGKFGAEYVVFGKDANVRRGPANEILVNGKPIETNGFKIVQLKVTDTPVGMSTWVCLEQLARMYNSGDLRGWNKGILERASKGVAAVKIVYDALAELYPSGASLNPENCPVAFETGISELDSHSSWFQGDVLLGQHQSLLNKLPERDDKIVATGFIPQGVEKLVVAKLRFFEGANKSAQGDPIAGEMLKQLFEAYKSFGYQVEKSAAFMRYAMVRLPSQIKADISTNRRTWSDIILNFNNSPFAIGYSEANGLTDTKGAFLHFISHYILRDFSDNNNNNKKLCNIFFFMIDEKEPYTISPSNCRTINQIDMCVEQFAKTSRGTPVNLDGNIDVPMSTTTSAQYRVSRLSISPAAFRNIPDTTNADAFQHARAHLLSAIPCHPQDPFKPLVALTYIPKDIRNVPVLDLGSWAEASARATRKSVYPSKYSVRGDPSGRKRKGDLDYTSSKRSRGPSGYKTTDDRDEIATGLTSRRFEPAGDVTYQVNNEWFTHTHLIDRMRRFMESNDPIDERLCAQLFLQSACHKNTLKRWLSKGVMIPESFTYADPFIYLTTGSIVMIDTENLGNTYYNFNDCSLTYDGINKRFTFHYTLYIGTSCRKKGRIVFFDDVCIKSVDKGMDGTINVDSSDFTVRMNMNSEHITKTGFIFSHGPKHKREYASRPFMTLTGELTNPIFAAAEDVSKNNMRWDGDRFYSKHWNFEAMSVSTTTNMNNFAARSDFYLKPNDIMVQGPQRLYNAQSKKFDTYLQAKGYLDGIAQDQLKDVLFGRSKVNIPA